MINNYKTKKKLNYKKIVLIYYIVAANKIDTINPNNAIASPNIRTNIIPTNTWLYLAMPLTPWSPTSPIAYPAAKALNPTINPENQIAKPLW